MDVPLNYIPGSITKEKKFGMTKVKEKYNMVFIQKVLKHLEAAVGGYFGKINFINFRAIITLFINTQLFY